MKMAMNRIGVYAETPDGTVHGPFRMTYKHRMLTERNCKANNVNMSSAEADVRGAWLTLRDQADTPFTGLSFDDFQSAVLDVTVQALDNSEGDESADPTPTDR